MRSIAGRIAGRIALGVAIAWLAVGCASPTPSDHPDVPASPEPSATPVDSPAPQVTPRAGALAVDLPFADDPAGRQVRLWVADTSGRLRGASGASPAELRLPAVGDPDAEPHLALVPGDPSAVVVTWSGTICDTTAHMTIGQDGSIAVAGGPVEPCDAMGVIRGVTLRFDGPVAVQRLVASFEPGPVVEVRPRRDADATALAMMPPGFAIVRAMLAAASDLEPRLRPAERLVWAVAIRNQGIPGSCPSPAPDVDAFTLQPCPAAGAATIFLDAVSGAYLGVVYLAL